MHFGGMSLLRAVDVLNVEAPAAAGQTTLTSDTIDMQRAEGLLALFSLGAITAGSTGKAQIHGSDEESANFSLMVDDYGNNCEIALDPTNHDNKILQLEIYKPRNRYIRLVLTRPTQDVVCNGIFGLRYWNSDVPTEDPDAYGTRAVFLNPLAS